MSLLKARAEACWAEQGKAIVFLDRLDIRTFLNGRELGSGGSNGCE